MFGPGFVVLATATATNGIRRGGVAIDFSGRAGNNPVTAFLRWLIERRQYHEQQPN